MKKTIIITLLILIILPMVNANIFLKQKENSDLQIPCTEEDKSLCNGDTNDDCNVATADGSDEAWLGDPCDGPDNDWCEEGNFYCNGVQCGRSVVSIKVARSCGYHNLSWFKGGFAEWKEKGFQYIKDPQHF